MYPKNSKSDDFVFWANYIKSVKPLHARKDPSMAAMPQSKQTSLHRIKISDNPTTLNTKKLSPPQTQQLKNIHLDGRLDLHGLNQAQAYQKLETFIVNSQSQNKKCVLVITGKGNAKFENWWEEKGILKNAVPRWLGEEPFKSRITNCTIAKPEHGGSGALYVFLRKKTR